MNKVQNQFTYFSITKKQLFLLSLLWLLIYLEPVSFGLLKLSQIWKAVAVVVLFLYLIKKKLPKFFWFGVAFAFKYLIYTSFPYGIIRAFQNSIESLIFPCLLGFFIVRYHGKRNMVNNLIHVAILFSLFMIYSTLPFIFGLKSLNPIRDLEQFGLKTNATTGLFYAISGASKVYVLATIIIFNCYKFFSNSRFNKALWLITIMVGIYFVYSSWARTGWFLFIIVLGFSFFYGSSLKQKIIALVVSLMIIMSVIYLYETNQAFRWRLSGGANYRTNTELSVEQLAKARLPFIITAIDNLKDEGIIGQFMGYGEQHSIDLFEKKTHMSITAHNKIFEILESSGIVGLLLFFGFLFLLFKGIFKSFKYYDKHLRKLLLASFLLFMGYTLVSHGSFIWTDIIFTPIFSIFILTQSQRRITSPNN